jgi:hypothetical protein
MNDASNEPLTDSELRKKAYLMGLRLKSSGLDAETIYARLEKQGIPGKLAREVAKDTVIERKKEIIDEVKTDFNVAFIKIGIGVLAAILVAIFFRGYGSGALMIIITGGIISALMAWNKMKK